MRQVLRGVGFFFKSRDSYGLTGVGMTMFINAVLFTAVVAPCASARYLENNDPTDSVITCKAVTCPPVDGRIVSLSAITDVDGDNERDFAVLLTRPHELLLVSGSDGHLIRVLS